LLIAVGSYAAVRREAEKREAAAAKAAASTSLLTDPAFLTIGLQLARIVGMKKLVPILALGGLALGLMSHKTTSAKDDDDEDSD
jgi:hypothetical protein